MISFKKSFSLFANKNDRLRLRLSAYSSILKKQSKSPGFIVVFTGVFIVVDFCSDMCHCIHEVSEFLYLQGHKDF